MRTPAPSLSWETRLDSLKVIDVRSSLTARAVIAVRLAICSEAVIGACVRWTARTIS